MKLRIRGNSLRLRLLRSEVEKIRRGDSVRESIEFSPVHRLGYSLERSREVQSLEAVFTDSNIRVLIPEKDALAWSGGREISLTGSQPLAAGASLSILVEKDFSCLHPHEGTDDGEFFARPEA